MPVEPTLESIVAALERLERRLDVVDAGREERSGGERPSLAFLAEQQRRLTEELGEVKDEVRVSTAMVQRLDAMVTGLANEVRVRAEHARYERLDKRLKRLEPEPIA